MEANFERNADLGSAIAGEPPVAAQTTARARIERLAPEILSARKRGWRIGQIVIALNDEFRKHSLPEISPGTFAKYISRLLTQHRVSLYDRRKYHFGVHE